MHCHCAAVTSAGIIDASLLNPIEVGPNALFHCCQEVCFNRYYATVRAGKLLRKPLRSPNFLLLKFFIIILVQFYTDYMKLYFSRS